MARKHGINKQRNTYVYVCMYVCMYALCEHKQTYSLRKGKKYSSQCRIRTNITNATVV